jgi:hypothetical protein
MRLWRKLVSEKTCAERIHSYKKSREDDLTFIFDKVEGSNDQEIENGYDELDAYPLSFEQYSVIKVLLSWGGPGDWLEIYLNYDNIFKVEYHFNDWFDHAQVDVDEESILYHYAEYVVNNFQS